MLPRYPPPPARTRDRGSPDNRSLPPPRRTTKTGVMNISGNTVFIPGSTSGIGLALALKLQARGNTVIVGGRRAAELERIAAEHPGLDTAEIRSEEHTSELQSHVNL